VATVRLAAVAHFLATLRAPVSSAVTYTVHEDGEVIRTDVAPNWVCTENGDVMWWPVVWGTRAKAMSRFAGEWGCGYIDVRCTVEWLRCVDYYEEARKVAVWAEEMWFSCLPTDVGAHKFWRCEPR
jgi:hypothetical protein